MPPKRAPVKVNPVTGELVVAKEEADGRRRDGSLRLPEKYLTAALDAGLGGRNGMYGHITTLNKVKSSGGGSALSAAAPPLREKNGDSGAPRGKGGIRQVVQGSSRKVSASTETTARMGEDVSFTKRKGVINTIGGAKDVTRAPKTKDESIRTSDRLKSSGIHTLSSFSSGSGRAPRAGSAGKGGVHTFNTLEHDSKVGLRKGDGTGGGAGTAVTTAPASKMGDLGSIRVTAPTKKPKASASKSGVKSGGRVGAGAPTSAGTARPAGGGGDVKRGAPIVRKLGGRGGVADSGKSDREKRLAYFEKKGL